MSRNDDARLTGNGLASGDGVEPADRRTAGGAGCFVVVEGTEEPPIALLGEQGSRCAGFPAPIACRCCNAIGRYRRPAVELAGPQRGADGLERFFRSASTRRSLGCGPVDPFGRTRWNRPRALDGDSVTAGQLQPEGNSDRLQALLLLQWRRGRQGAWRRSRNGRRSSPSKSAFEVDCWLKAWSGEDAGGSATSSTVASSWSPSDETATRALIRGPWRNQQAGTGRSTASVILANWRAWTSQGGLSQFTCLGRCFRRLLPRAGSPSNGLNAVLAACAAAGGSPPAEPAQRWRRQRPVRRQVPGQGAVVCRSSSIR